MRWRRAATMLGEAHLPSGAVEPLLHGGELRADELFLA